MRASVLFFPLICIPVFCVLNAPIEEDYYSNKENILGGEKPSTPVLNYDTGTLKLSWTQSIDPDTGNSVSRYIIYRYFNTFPEDPYHPRHKYFFIDDGSLEASFTSPISVKGEHIFGITASDGNRESALSNLITISVP